MRALSIRQPFAELILRGMKTIEYRSRATSIVGERFWIYASKGQVRQSQFALALPSPGGRGLKSDNISAAPPPPWMVELANAMRLFPESLPTGVIVGSAVIARCVQPSSFGLHPYYEWHLTDVQRCEKLQAPRRHPQPVWFRPF